MKTNKWILGGLMAMAITACTSDELVENTNPTQGKKVTVTAYAPGDKANSRVSFTDDNASKVTLSWKDSESFSVVYYTTAQTFSKTTAGNTFTGVLPYDEENWQDSYYAVYPALSVNTSLTTANTVPFDLSTQTGALDESKTYMRAVSDNGFTYSFEHCTAILKATFANIPEGTKINQVVVKTSHADSKIDGNLNLADGTISSGSKNTITINYTTAVDASTPVYIYLPPMAADKKGLEFQVSTTDGDSYTGTLGAASTPELSEGESSNANQGQGIVAGKLYAASVQMSKVKLIAEGLSFDPDSQTFSVTTAFALQLLDKWISYNSSTRTFYLTTANFKKYEFEGNASDLINDNNRFALNISIKADIELPLTDILTGDSITLDENGVPSGSNWIPLQKKTDSEFAGSIDGINGTDGKYSIKNLRIKGGSTEYQGFVGRLSGSVTNLEFKDAVVVATSHIGIVVGANSGGTVRHCDVTGNSMVNGPSIVGGVVGVNINGTVDNCSNNAKVKGENSAVGGVIGYFQHNVPTTTISNCKNYGEVISNASYSLYVKTNVGGIVGNLFNGTANIIDCENYGAIAGPKLVGGILGNSYGTEGSMNHIERCFNYGAVSGTDSNGEQFVGGIVGNIEYASIQDCNNSASVTGHGFYIGGIVGTIKKSILTNCKNIASESRSESMAVSGVETYSQRVGGIAGYIYESTVENCENNCPVSGATPIGGIVGYATSNSTSNSTVRGCINYGTTTATCVYRLKGVGGVVGYIEGNSTVENCKNNSQVSGIEHVGGIVGHNTGSSIVLGSINNGNVVSEKYAGGIVGYNETAGVIACGNNATTITSPKYVGGVVGGMIGTPVYNNWTANVGIYGSWSICGNNYYGYDQKSFNYYYHDKGNYVGDAATLNAKVGSKDDGTSGNEISMNKALANYYGTNLGSSLTTKYYWVEGGNGNCPVFLIPTSAGLNNFGFGGNLTPSEK